VVDALVPRGPESGLGPRVVVEIDEVPKLALVVEQEEG
jgi:hypothetical protein